jgi:hypothetical protein
MTTKGRTCLVLSLACVGLIVMGAHLRSQADDPVPVVEVDKKIPKKSAAEWQKAYPFKSLEERLQFEAGRKPVKPTLSAEAAKRLDDADESAKRMASSTWGRNVRTESLKLLHSKEVEDFIKRDGFGERRIPTPSLRYLNLPPGPSIPFENVSYKPSDVDGEKRVQLADSESTERRAPLPALQSLLNYHDFNERNFASPQSYGLIKDKKNVAGFEPHQFRYRAGLNESFRPQPKNSPKDKERWALHRLELVSLLKHEKPVVYVSEVLPRMEDLKKTKTRPLGAFEEAGLKELQGGKDVVTDSSTNRIRMMGSLRARAECLQCHTGERGELLGVFSYELLRDPPLKLQ